MSAPLLALYDSWYWPAIDTDARAAITRDCGPDIAALLPHVKGRDLIVQAGANVGVYPVALAEHFACVVTAEPDPVNWACLEKNLAAHGDRGRIDEHYAAFGAAAGQCRSVPVKATNTGAHRVEFAPVMDSGAVPVITIDSLRLPGCDAIWLDVEGAEVIALVGAVDTIARFSPTICVEDKGLHRAFGIPDGHLQAWLAERGYEQVDRFGRDKIFRRA